MAADHSINRNAFGHWLSGFTDGEGSFNLISATGNKTTKRTIPRASFSIQLRSDDRPVLELIQGFWGVGHIYDANARVGRWNNGPTSKYQVAKIKEIVDVVIPHFEKFSLVAKKKRDFLIWKEGVKILDLVVNHRSRKYSYRGAWTKWHAGEREQFNLLASTLKEQRKFESIAMEIPETPPLNGKFKTRYLFE